MSGGLIFPLRTPQVRRKAADAILTAPDGWVVEVREPRRSDEQSRRMYAMLDDVAHQVTWHGCKYDRYDWKAFALASTTRELRMMPDSEGHGMVPLGYSSSRLTKRQMTDVIDFLFAFGAREGVVWRDPALRNPREMAA